MVKVVKDKRTTNLSLKDLLESDELFSSFVYYSSKPPIIGVTGKLAAGKSLVSRIIEAEYGARIFDSDVEEWRFLQNNRGFSERVSQEFGCGILDARGTVDSAKFLETVFNVPGNWAIWEKMIHPVVSELCKKFINKVKSGDQMGVLNIPLLLERTYHKDCDFVLYISANREVRLRRFINRLCAPEEDALRRFDTLEGLLMDEEEALEMVDVVLTNDDDHDCSGY